MRRRISSHIRWTRFPFIVIAFGLLYNIISSLADNYIDQEGIIIKLVFLVVCCGLYYLLDKAKTVEFDDDFMYLSGKTVEEIIPLKDIYKIKLTMTSINNRKTWKIGYFDKDRTEKSVRILPRWFHKHFDEFKDCVKASNRDAKIISWSHSFDFDQ